MWVPFGVWFACTPSADQQARSECGEASFDTAGGELTFSGATLSLPSQALAAGPSQTVRLCVRDEDDENIVSRVWTLGPETLLLEGPVSLRIEHDGPDTGTRLIVPGRGAPAPSFDATAASPGFFEGLVYRPGDVWVALDDRIETPYGVAMAADILFVVDNSCAMQDDQARAAGASSRLLASLGAENVDYHVGVTTTTVESGGYDPNGAEGRLRTVGNTSWVSPSTSSKETLLDSMIRAGGNGSGSERGFAALLAAVDDQGDAKNAGFFRDEASFAVIFVSDEPNHRVAGDPTGEELIDWLEDLRALPAFPTAFSATVPGGLGVSYREVVEAFGGVDIDIQGTGFGNLYEDVATALAAGQRMPLPAPIAADTVEAWWVPDDAEPTRFSAADVDYDPTDGTVRVFLGDRPADEVRILFEAGY